VERGVTVRIINEPYKFGYENGVMFLEAHAPLDGFFHPAQSHKLLTEQLLVQSGMTDPTSWQRVSAIQAAQNGLPIPFAETQSAHPEKRWYLQVGAFTVDSAALDLQQRLKDIFSLPVETTYAQAENLTRVLIGPANSRNLLFAYAALIKYAMGIEGMVRESAPSL
jgi:cell division septation protein DedD